MRGLRCSWHLEVSSRPLAFRRSFSLFSSSFQSRALFRVLSPSATCYGCIFRYLPRLWEYSLQNNILFNWYLYCRLAPVSEQVPEQKVVNTRRWHSFVQTKRISVTCNKCSPSVTSKHPSVSQAPKYSLICRHWSHSELWVSYGLWQSPSTIKSLNQK